MKNRILFIALVLVGLMSTSCTHYIYDVRTLQDNYNARMKTKEELEIKSKVKIFTSEKDIKGDYELISINGYTPMRLLPFAKPYVKRTSKNFYKKAVMMAYEEGGNGVIIISPMEYKVIQLLNFNEEEAQMAKFSSPIFNAETMKTIQSGEVDKMTRNGKRKIINRFEEEIKTNVTNLSYPAEIKMTREKLEAYSKYNSLQKHPKHSVEKFIKKQTKKVDRKDKKISKRIAKNKVDSLFLANSAICDQQWNEYKKISPSKARKSSAVKSDAKAATPKQEKPKQEVKEPETPKQEVKQEVKQETAEVPQVEEPKTETPVATPAETHENIVRLYKEGKKTGNIVYKSYVTIYANLSGKTSKSAQNNLAKVQEVMLDYLNNPKKYRNLISELKQTTSYSKQLKAFLKA